MDDFKIKEEMTILQFKMRCQSGFYNDNTSGIFMLVKDDKVSDKHIMPSDCNVIEVPEWATGIVWIDKNA